jgi:hypothetical protein
MAVMITGEVPRRDQRNGHPDAAGLERGCESTPGRPRPFFRPHRRRLAGSVRLGVAGGVRGFPPRAYGARVPESRASHAAASVLDSRQPLHPKLAHAIRMPGYSQPGANAPGRGCAEVAVGTPPCYGYPAAGSAGFSRSLISAFTPCGADGCPLVRALAKRTPNPSGSATIKSRRP